MSLNLKKIKYQCLDEKYYEPIKYMAHTLTGNDRYQFIRQVCRYNIYLGAICATTCEYEKQIDSYIKRQLNGFFDDKQIKYYDKKTGRSYEYKKQTGKSDVKMFIMASYEIGNFEAVKWAVYNFDVNINTLIKIGQKVSEAEYVDLLFTISKSRNQDKMTMMCRTRSIHSQKYNPSVKELLTLYWQKDRQIFTYLADSFGWLSDLDRNEKYGEMIYAKCFEGSDNSVAFNNLIINAISVEYRDGLERLFRIIDSYGEEDVKKNLYMLFYIKLQNRFPVCEREYKALESVNGLTKRELFLGKKTISDVVNSNCSSWINIFDMIYYFPVSVREEMKLRETDRPLSRNIYPLNEYLDVYNNTPISRVIYTYFVTDYCNHIYLDDFVMMLSEHYNISISEACGLLDEYEDEGSIIQRGSKSYLRHRWKTLNNPVMFQKGEFGEKYRLQYRDYDYIEHQFYVECKPVEDKI